MFPICGGLKNGKYTYGGKEYQLPKHGFAKLNEFTVESSDSTTAVFVLCDSEDTRAVYPFEFEFKVIYRLVGDSVEVTYSAKSCGENVMYCSFGAHEAYATPEGIEAYDIIFPQKETLYAYALNGDLLTDYTKMIIEDSCVLPLKDEFGTLQCLDDECVVDEPWAERFDLGNCAFNLKSGGNG
jgi:galactose mutarotase-like enzyme